MAVLTGVCPLADNNYGCGTCKYPAGSKPCSLRCYDPARKPNSTLLNLHARIELPVQVPCCARSAPVGHDVALPDIATNQRNSCPCAVNNNNNNNNNAAPGTVVINNNNNNNYGGNCGGAHMLSLAHIMNVQGNDGKVGKGMRL